MKVEPKEFPVAQVAAQPRESPRVTAAAAALPAGTARAPRYSTALTLIAFCIFLLGLLWSTVIVKLHAEHEAEIRDVMKDTANLARVFEEHTVRTFREADQTLQFIIDQYREHGNKIDLRRLAEDGPIINRIYTYISIIDEHGNLAAGSQPFKPMNLADREHFQVHVAQDTGRLFISKPLVGRASGKQSIQLSRRINKPDLSFGGVAVVSVDPAYFSRFYSALDLGSRGLVNVTGREDKIIRARRAGNDTTVGQDASKGDLFKHLPASERGSYVSAGVMTGVSRILSYRALEDYPLVVLVGVATDEALTAFNQRSRHYYQAAALASLLILSFTALLLLMVSRQEKTARTLRRRNIELDHASEASARLAAIVENSNDAIISRALDRKILTWNTAAERLFGWTAVEAIGQSVSLFIPPERADESNRNQTLVQADQPVPAYDTVRRTKDGRRIDVSLTHSPIKNERGETVSVALIFRDIGERKRAEQAHAQLAAIVENSNDAIISRSPDGRFVSWNQGAERMFGYTAAEAIGQPITLILPPEQRKDVALKVETTRRGEAPAPYETRRVTKDGRIIDVVASVSPIRNAAGQVAAVSIIFHDITERKQAQEQIAFLSQYDTLTGLPNRNLFRDRLELAIARAKRQREMVGIMLFNLDRFKQVNEGLGLEAGDELLRQVAARLNDTLREVDTIARLGSDEFAILVEGMPTSADVTAVAEKLIEEFAIPFQVKGTEVVAVPSIGITIHPNGTDNSQVLLEHAEIAMERVKREGGGGYRLYDDEPATSRGGRFDLETRLRHALERGEFALHYQPKVRLLDGAITGAEALLRWNAPELGAISPAKFIPIAEESGLIVPIGEWVLRTACAQMQSWHEQGHSIGIAVNLSPRQFRQKDLVSSVAEVLKQSGLAPQHLELEITEGTAMTNAERAINILRELHGLGAKLSVDDFGTGYSSLAYLKRFPLDSLKIDRSFVVDVGADTNSEAIMRATIALAQSLKLKVVAEGVETEAQRDFLVRAGCDEMQGYLYSRPLPAAEFLALLVRASGEPSA